MQVRVEGNDSYESLAAQIAAKVNIPECHWYLTFSGKDLRHMPCPTSVLHRDSTFRVQSRLLDGAPLQPTPGEWFCPARNRGGCWASRRTCFRCLAGVDKRRVVTSGNPPDCRSNFGTRVRLTIKTRPSVISHFIPDPGHSTLRRWKRLRLPSSVGEEGEVDEPRNLFLSLGVG